MQGHDSHQLKKPDTSFISTLQRSHPGARIAVLTDQATQIELPAGVRLFRYTLDRSKLGRNAYANYYQYLAQVGCLIWLNANCSTHSCLENCWVERCRPSTAAMHLVGILGAEALAW